MSILSKLWDRLFGRALDRGLPPPEKTDAPSPFYKGGVVTEGPVGLKEGEIAVRLTPATQIEAPRVIFYDAVNETERGREVPVLTGGLDLSKEPDRVSISIVQRALEMSPERAEAIERILSRNSLDLRSMFENFNDFRAEQRRERQQINRPSIIPRVEDSKPAPEPVLAQRETRRFKLRSKPTKPE